MAKKNFTKGVKDEKVEEARNKRSPYDSTKKTSSGSRRPTKKERKQRRDTERVARAATSAINAILDNVSVETPVSGNPTLLFPSDSASMQAFGNMITTPGQNNFIEDFNNIKSRIPGVLSPQFTVGNTTAERTANVMVLGFTPYFGHMQALEPSGAHAGSMLTDPLIIAATNLKQFIDTTFGTRINYDPQDLLIYLMAVAAIFPMIAEIKRDLRLIYTTLPNQYPQFIPNGLYAALAIPDGDGNFTYGQGALYTSRHLREYIDELNQLIIMFNRLPMPPEILAFQYNDDLFDAIYTDAPDVTTAQLYAFKLVNYWKYVEADPSAETGAYLDKRAVSAQEGYSISAKLTRLKECIEPLTALRTSSTAMLQNLYNAYGSRDTIQVPTLDINALDPVPFVFSEGILTAIENSVVCPASSVTITDITTDSATNSIRGRIYADLLRHYEMGVDLPLQFHKSYEQVTATDIGWALRFHPSFKTVEYADDGTTQVLSARGYTPFAIINTVAAYYVDMSDGTVSGISLNGRAVNTDDPISTGGFVRKIQVMNDFVAAPMIMDVTISTPEGAVVYNLKSYTSRRDVELTYRLEDMYMHWSYLTLTVWAGNINRNAQGTRTRS